MHYYIIAGEASGDLHAAALITELRRLDSEARFTFMGGDMMAAAAGCAPVVHYRDMAYMGFSEVLRHLGRIRANLATARRTLLDARPDALIAVDYPSFNLKVAATARKAGIPVYYYISPKVWAWKQWRVKTIRRLVDKVLCILPFEEEFYRQRGVEAEYVGNPSVEEVDATLAALGPVEAAATVPWRSERPQIVLLPGSRHGEIRCNLPVMEAAVARFPQYRVTVAGAPGIEPEYYKAYTRRPVVFGRTYDLLRRARAALVTSGTATLEAALIGVPQVVMYRSNGSRVAYELMRRLLHVEYVSLPNLIVGEEIIPELLLHDCSPDTVACCLGRITADGSAREAMLDGYRRLRSTLGTTQAAPTAAAAIIAALRRRQSGQ
ncbi:MAG: lipid-A-disaccharide synthase [Muribaculaceae bacterium]